MGESYWEDNTPWSFRDMPPDKRPSYEQRRRMRYELQDYQPSAIGFGNYSGKQVLEVGCGAGIDAVEFAKHGAEVTAVDSSQAALEETVATRDEANVTVHVIRTPISAMELRKPKGPFADDSFDLVYCFGVLHHLTNPLKAMCEAWAVLKKGGEYVAMVYNQDSLLYAYSIEHLGLPFERVAGVPNTCAFTVLEINDLLKVAGFVNISIKPYYNVIDLPFQRKVKLNIPDEFGLGWHLVCKSKK